MRISTLAAVLLISLANLAPAVAQGECFPVPDGLIAWWDGDSVVGASAIDIEGSNDGVMQDGVTVVPGKVGSAFEFNGTGVVTTPLVNSYSSGITFDAWVKTTDSSGYHVLVTNGGQVASVETGMGLGITDGQAYCSGNYGVPGANAFVAVLPGPVVADGEFHHVACTWTGDTSMDGARMYVDGVLSGTDTSVASVSTSSRGLDIGGHAVHGFGLTGIIDEIEVFGRVLTAAEIQAIFEAGIAGKCKDEDGDGYRPPEDCDETDPRVNPDGLELPGNFIDEDCNGDLGDCDPCFAWRNHGEYIRCTSREAEALVDTGDITQGEADQLVTDAARSDIGKKGYDPPECQ